MSFDEQLRQAFDSLTDRLRGEIAREVRAVVDELEAAAKSERDRTADQAARSAADAARAAADDEARKAIEAARQAAEAALGEARAQLQTADLSARERLLAAIRAIDSARSLTEIFDALSLAAEREAARTALLLVRDGSLRAWRFSGFNKAMDGSSDSQVAFDENGVIGEAVRTLAVASADSAAPPPFELPAGRSRVAVPIAIGGQAVGVMYADEGGDPDAERAPAPGWSAAIEILGRHAARALEALTAFKTARALSDRASLPRTSTDAGDRSDADEAARRYARLLVSEIKLYHEPEVVAGRRDRDLAVRLAGEIERARALYEARVPAAVRLRTDFFQAELVRTLANGDASLLEVKS